LILLDLGLPDGDGLRFFAQMKSSRKAQKTPVIILTGRDELSSKITAFSLGAEDYIVKPFDTQELLARAKAKIVSAERKRLREEPKNILIADLEIRMESYDVFLDQGAEKKKIELTLKEYRLLLLFAQSPNRVFAREDLLSKIWRNEYVLDRTIDTHVSRLRKKLSESKIRIEPVPGVGYRLIDSEPDKLCQSQEPPNFQESA
jgi:DNA-binding response OmpR family regulator